MVATGRISRVCKNLASQTTRHGPRGVFTVESLGFHNMILTYKGVVLSNSHTGFTSLPGKAVLDTCVYQRASVGRFEARRVHSWILKCFDKYNNRVELDQSQLSAAIVPSSSDMMFTYETNNQGDVSIHLR